MATLTPVDFDPFAGEAQAPLRITVNPGGKLTPVDHDPFAGDANPVADALAGMGTGVAKGVAGLAGLPGTIGEAWNSGAETAVRFLSDKLGLPQGFADDVMAGVKKGREYSFMKNLPTGGDIQSKMGPMYKPQTTIGRGAETVGEFVPGALAGPGGIARNLTNFALVPGVASEAAGRVTEGTSLETPARIGAAVVAGGGAAMLNRPRTAERALRGAMSPEVDSGAVDRAGQLMDDAAQRGVQLTWAEALEQVAPGSGLTNMQRVLESTSGSREILSPVMAQRPGQVENAARQTFDTIAPPNAAPSGIGPAAGTAAEDTANAVRQRINQVAEPFYNRAQLDRVAPADMGRIRRMPGWPEARDAVRNDPQLNRYVAHLPENSVGFINEVKKYLNVASENAGAPVNAQRNMQRSAGYGADAATARQAGVDASLAYETALAIETHGRERFLQPLLDGPLGKIASKDTKTQQAIEALFPKNPLPNSEQEITTAVRAIAQRNPRVARDLVRAHAEATFNEAARNLQSGANQWGGGNFAKAIAGNAQQRSNLESAVTAMGHDGAEVWRGFNRFLDIVEATGMRQHVGSKTAFNTQELKDLATGNSIGNAIKTGASPGKWVSKVEDLWSRWQLGRNVERLADILVNPQSRRLLSDIAARPVGREAEILATRLAVDALQSRGHEVSAVERR